MDKAQPVDRIALVMKQEPSLRAQGPPLSGDSCSQCWGPRSGVSSGEREAGGGGMRRIQPEKLCSVSIKLP